MNCILVLISKNILFVITVLTEIRDLTALACTLTYVTSQKFTLTDKNRANVWQSGCQPVSLMFVYLSRHWPASQMRSMKLYSTCIPPKIVRLSNHPSCLASMKHNNSSSEASLSAQECCQTALPLLSNSRKLYIYCRDKQKQENCIYTHTHTHDVECTRRSQSVYLKRAGMSTKSLFHFIVALLCCWLQEMIRTKPWRTDCVVRCIMPLSVALWNTCCSMGSKSVQKGLSLKAKTI